jgi:hypothetical protein
MAAFGAPAALEDRPSRLASTRFQRSGIGPPSKGRRSRFCALKRTSLRSRSRAIGVVHQDEGLIGQALERFEALKLDWHAEQTRALL